MKRGSLMLLPSTTEVPKIHAELFERGIYLAIGTTSLDYPEMFVRSSGREIIGERAIRAFFGLPEKA